MQPVIPALHLSPLCVSVQLRVVTPDVSISPENLADVYDLFKVFSLFKLSNFRYQQIHQLYRLLSENLRFLRKQTI